MLPISTEAWHRYDVESLDANVYVEPDFDTDIVPDMLDAAASAAKEAYDPTDTLGPGCFGVVTELGGYVLKVSLRKRKYTLADAAVNHGLQVGLTRIRNTVINETGLEISAPQHHVIISPKNPYTPRVYAASLMDIAPGSKAFNARDLPTNEELGGIYNAALAAVGFRTNNILPDHSPHHLFVVRDTESGRPTKLTKLDVQPIGEYC